MASRRILISGASGFIGACLARSLSDKGQEIHVLLRNQSNLWRIKDKLGAFTTHNVDLLDRDGVFALLKEVRPDIVYHLAAYGAYAYQKDPKSSVLTNILGTINLADASLDHTGSFINVSSSSEYGIKDHPMREDDLLEPNSIYGTTKAAATLYCHHLARENGAPITTFRIFAAYGYYEDPTRLMPSVILPFLRNESPKLSSPYSVRDFIFVEDITNAFEKAASMHSARGQVLNLGCGIQHPIGEVVSLVKEFTGARKEAIWGSMEKKQLEPTTWVADMSKTKATLEWAPRYDLKAGLKKTVDWYKNNLQLYNAPAPPR